jgi:hypothetical protein
MPGWTLKAHPDFLAMLYTLPRGEAAKVTEAIRGLAIDPTPPTSTPIEDRPGRRMLPIDVYTVTYEIREDQAAIRLLILRRIPNR